MNSYNGFSPAQRTRAQAWLNREWESGRLARPHVCCACGQSNGIIDAHAEDYSEPFQSGKTDEYHLCFICHMMVHCRFRNHTAWARYRSAVARGVQFRPYMRRDFQGFSGLFLRSPELFNQAKQSATIVAAPCRLVLDEIDQSPFAQVRNRA